MEESPYLTILQHLFGAWEKDHPGARRDPGFWLWREAWVPDAFADRIPPQFVDDVEVDGKPWAMVVAADKLHFVRLADDHLEVLFVGALPGGDYRETIGDRIRIEFSHPRLQQLKIVTPLVLEGSRQATRLQPIRDLFRRWAETPAAD